MMSLEAVMAYRKRNCRKCLMNHPDLPMFWYKSDDGFTHCVDCEVDQLFTEFSSKGEKTDGSS